MAAKFNEHLSHLRKVMIEAQSLRHHLALLLAHEQHETFCEKMTASVKLCEEYVSLFNKHTQAFSGDSWRQLHFVLSAESESRDLDFDLHLSVGQNKVWLETLEERLSSRGRVFTEAEYRETFPLY